MFRKLCVSPLKEKDGRSVGGASVCEKEKLLSERNQLKVCMADLWQNLSYLSQEVCRDTQGSPDKIHEDPALDSATAAGALARAAWASEGGSSGDVCSATVTVDFCQEMTEKCTTGEQQAHGCT
ncbi:unnamed protein product [Merluccius merluccius]